MACMRRCITTLLTLQSYTAAVLYTVVSHCCPAVQGVVLDVPGLLIEVVDQNYCLVGEA